VVETFHVSVLKIFHGTRDAAYELALRDQDQHVIQAIIGYKGDPMKRTSMSFLVRFADNDEVWLPWSRDLFDSIPYESFCRSRPPLFPLIFSEAFAQAEIQKIKRANIVAVQPGDSVYVDLRCYGAPFYDSLGLPDAHTTRTYVVVYEYTKWSVRTHKRQIDARCPVFDELWPRLDNYFVRSYGSCKVFDATTMVLIDAAFCVQHPSVLPAQHAPRLLREYRARVAPPT
jgi:hypothetical protein